MPEHFDSGDCRIAKTEDLLDVIGETVPRFEEAGRGGFMRRFLTLVCLLCVAIPAGISISGCTRNPAGNYCNGLGYGLKDTDVASIFLTPQTTGISLAFGQTQQIGSPSAKTCKGTSASVGSYTYGTTNNQLVDISPSGIICAGTWNRNSGGGIPNYTICNKPDPLPSTGGLPYGTAYVTASANSVTSNPVAVYIHAQVTSVNLVTQPLTGSAQQCYSQNQVAQLNSQACFVGSNNTQQLLCAPSSVTKASSPSLVCPLPSGVSLSAIPDCSAPLGTLNYTVGSASIASINSDTNQITASQPGTTVITASVAGGSSTAGYFSTCPPASISVTLANGSTSGTITKGVEQNLTTTVVDTLGETITGLTLDYQSTDPIDISANGAGGITTNFPGQATVYAICQPPDCNSTPINVTGIYGTGLPVTSNPVQITTPGTASDYVWFGAPNQSQYFASIDLLTGTAGSTVRLPYVPNSMVMDRTGTNLYFGSEHELMYYSTTSNTLSKQDTNAPGVVLAASPSNSQLLINDQVRQVFYLYNVSGGTSSTFGGMGAAAAWTPDSQTLYITDSAALNLLPEVIAAGTNHHSDTLYVYSENTGWSSYPLASSAGQKGAQNLAIAIPSVGAYLSGSTTVAHTWCPTGTVANGVSTITSYYPQGDSVSTATDVLAATIDGKHILGATTSGGAITLADIGVTIPTSVTNPTGVCPSVTTGSGASAVQTLKPLLLTHTTPNLLDLTNVSATDVRQVISSPASTLAFITYDAATASNQLPYYIPGTGSAAGTLGYVPLATLKGNPAPTAPLAGAFTPDNATFFVSTSGDNLVHFISIPTLTDTQQIAPALPACVPVAAGGNDLGCGYTGSGTVVPATVIAVKPRSTT
jgi:hypothetical protein